jgi:hypothetical protein
MVLWGIIIAGATAAYYRWRSVRADAVYIFVLLTVVLSVEADLPALVATASKSIPFAILFCVVNNFPVAWVHPGYSTLLGGQSSVSSGRGER